MLSDIFSEVLGTEVRVPENPSRIVSFSPAATETLFAIGLGDRLVGVSAFCARPPETSSKRKVGSYNTVRDELLEELHPDLIITVTGYQREFALKLARKFPVYPLELPVSVAGIADFVVKVGLVAGAHDRGRDMAGSLLRRLGEVKPVGRLSGYVEIDLGGPVSFGAYSYITDALHLVGCESLYARERAEWLKPDLDHVKRSDPDMIFYEPKMFAERKEGGVEDMVKERGWEALRAVAVGNVFVTPGPLDFLAHHGPSFVTEAIPWLERAMRTGAENIAR
jgi:iron complex transport system substrate-binding protein